MIKVTQEGKQLAARYRSQVGVYADEYLATQSLADKATLAELQASYDAAKADLAKIDQLQRSVQNDDGERQLRDVMAEISKLVADYRVETDPLVEEMIDSGLKQFAEIFERGLQSVAKLAEIIDARMAKVTV